MALIDETAVAAANRAGFKTLAEDTEILFVRYIRQVLPIDGYVFWLNTGVTVPVTGSLHVTMDQRQLEDETLAINRVVLTTNDEVQPFNAIGPDQLWVGTVNATKFAFSRSGPRYRVSGLFHYSGDAVYPALESQLIDIGSQLSDRTEIVSSSLPAWLALQSYAPEWLDAPNPNITLYPSFLVPNNLPPPYGTVHVFSESTHALQAFPSLGHTYENQHQLVAERVRITLYGLTNERALDFANLVQQFSLDIGAIGLMSCPVIRDPQRPQSEIGVIAMKKTIEYEVSYYQSALRGVARALIQSASAIVGVLPDYNPFAPGVPTYAPVSL